MSIKEKATALNWNQLDVSGRETVTSNYQQMSDNLSSDEDGEMNNIEASFDYNDKYEDESSDGCESEDQQNADLLDDCCLDKEVQKEIQRPSLNKQMKQPYSFKHPTSQTEGYQTPIRQRWGQEETKEKEDRVNLSKEGIKQTDQKKDKQSTIASTLLSDPFSATTNQRKKKSVVSFSIRRNLLQSCNAKTDQRSFKSHKTFRVVQTVSDPKSLPNIDKFKAKLNKLRQKPPQITSKSWAVFNGKNKKLLAGQMENTPREIASLTKMMTCYIVCNYVQKLNLIPERTFFCVSEHAANQPGTSAQLKTGEVISVTDLLYGMMLPSGNDAAFVLAENFGVYLFMHSEEFKEKYNVSIAAVNETKQFKVKNPMTYFIREMNRLAEKFNMVDTYFTNPHGLMQKKNKSSAYDVGLLALQLLQNPLAREIISKQTHTANILTENMEIREPKITWKNTNKLLKRNGFLGLKTGITCAAGPCLATWFKQEKVNLVVILLSSRSLEERWSETEGLVQWVRYQLGEEGEEETKWV